MDPVTSWLVSNFLIPSGLGAGIASLFGGSGREATPMTSEERAKFEAESRLALASSGLAEGGEGAYETLMDALSQASSTENVSQQEIADILGASGFANIPTLSGSTEPTLVEMTQEKINKAASAVGKAQDAVFDIFGIPKPDYSVIQPNAPGATVIWGEPSGGVFGRIGTTPGGTVTGVQTGIPALDVVLGKVADVVSGRTAAGEVLTTATIQEIILQTAGDELGIPGDPNKILADIKEIGSKVFYDDETGKIGIDLGDGSATPTGETPTLSTDRVTTTGGGITSTLPTGETPTLTPDKVPTGGGITSTLPTGETPTLTTDKVPTGGGITSTLPTGETPTLTTDKVPTGGGITSTLPTGETPTLTTDKVTTGGVTLDKTPTLTTDKVPTGGITLDKTPTLTTDKVPTGDVTLDKAPTLITDKAPTGDVTLDKAPVLVTDRTGTIDPTLTERTPTLTTDRADEVPGGGSPGGGGLGQQSGVRTVSGGPGPLVDIDYLYDFKDSLLQPFRVTDDEDEIEGRRVRKFNGTTGSEVLNSGVTAQDYLDATSGNQGNTGVRNTLSQFVGDNAGALLASAVGGLFGLKNNDEQQPAGYQGGIPDYQFNRELKTDAFSAVNPDGSTRRPGSMGRSYFDYGAVPFTGTGVMQGVGIPAAVATDTGGIAGLDTSALTSTGNRQENEEAVGDTTLTGGDTTLTGGDTTLTGGDTTLTGGDTTLTGGDTTPTAYDTFADSLKGRELTAEDAAAIAASGYSLNDLASTLSTATAPIDALALRNFINYYTSGSTTTDDGKVGPVGMGNLLVELGGTRNADGTITDVFGTNLSVQDGVWKPVAGVGGEDTTVTDGTTVTGTTTTDTTGGTTTTGTTAYDNFIASYAAKDLADFTSADYTALANSGYDLSTIAASLSVTESSLANALDTYSSDNVAFRNFMGSLPATLSSAEDAQALLNSGYSLEKIASGYTNTTASQLQTFIDGFGTPTTTVTDGTTGADAVDTLLNSVEQGMVASGNYTDNGDGTITANASGYVYDNETGEGYFPTTATTTVTNGTTVTDGTTGADAVDTLLNSVEQGMVASGDYTDNGDGTITDNASGYVYDNETGEGYFPTTATTGADTTSSLELFAQNNAGKTLTTDDLVTLNDLAGEGYSAQDVINTLNLTDADGNPISETQLNSTLSRAVGTNTLNTIAADTDGLDEDQVRDIAGLITSNTFGISDVAEEFGVSDGEVIAGLIRGDYQTLAQIADRYEDLSEVDLVSILLSENLTTPAEIAGYYNIPESEVRSYARSEFGLDLAGGGYLGYAQGGDINGYYLGGTTDGMADQIPATIDNNQPAALSDGEFVIPADVVSHLGNGNSDAGAKNLYSMMDRVRVDRTGNPNQGRQINPNKYLA